MKYESATIKTAYVLLTLSYYIFVIFTKLMLSQSIHCIVSSISGTSAAHLSLEHISILR